MNYRDEAKRWKDRFKVSEKYPGVRRELDRPKYKWIDFEGFRFLVNEEEYVGRSMKKGSFHEKELKEAFKRELGKGDSFIDIGAHIGSTTALMREQVGKEGEGVAFEPDPINFSLLEKNVEKNSWDNVNVVQKAVSDSEGKSLIRHMEGNTGRSRLETSKRRNGEELFEVEKVDIVEILEGKGADWIKIDVEGHEHEIIKGMERRLDSIHGIFLDVHSDLLSRNNLRSIYKILETHGDVMSLQEEKIGFKRFKKADGRSEGFLWLNSSV